MAKISALPEKAVPTGAETVVILDGGISKRTPIGPLVEAAGLPQLAAAQSARAGAEAAVATLVVRQTLAKPITPVAGTAFGTAGVRVFASYATVDDFLEEVNVFSGGGNIHIFPMRLDAANNLHKQSGPSKVLTVPAGTAQLRQFTEKDFGRFPIRAGETVGVYASTGTIHNGGTSTIPFYAANGLVNQVSTASPITANGPNIQFKTRGGGVVNLNDKTANVRSQLPDIEIRPQMVSDKKKRAVTISRTTPIDLHASPTEAVVIDQMLGEGPLPIASGTGGVWQAGDYDPTFQFKTGQHYKRLGNTTYELRRGAVYPIAPTTTADAGSIGFPCIMWDVSPVWYASQHGCTIRGKFFLPPSVGANTAEVNLMARFGGGNRVVIRVRNLSDGTTNVTVSTLGADGSGATAYSNTTALASDIGREVEIMLRCYGEDMWEMQVDGLNLSADPQFYKGVVRTSLFSRSLYPGGVVQAGFGFANTTGNYRGANCTGFSIDTIPQKGSTWYRPLPPMPAPVVPPMTKKGEVFNGAMSAFGANQPYGNFSVINMAAIKERLGITPLDNYYGYYSSDHASAANAGLWMVYGPTKYGPWTKYIGPGPNGRLYVDAVAGEQTEFPVARYDEEFNLIRIMHQQKLIPGQNGQRSVMTESLDGLNLTRIGVCTTIDSVDSAFDHDGYSTFFRDPLGVVRGWPAFWRMSAGATDSRWTVAHSEDGRKFTPDYVPLRMPALQELSRRDVGILQCPGYDTSPFAYRGQRLLPISPFKILGGGARGYVAIVTLGDDMRNMSAAEYIIEPTLPTEVGNPVVSGLLVEDNKATLYVNWDIVRTHAYEFDLIAPPPGYPARPF